ncbi:hypothetical protein ACQ4PT_014517 [Festuca glaucescens]
MAPTWMELAVTWLSVYVYRGVPLLSLSMHLILAIFSESRRREEHGWKRLLVWVAYQLTDWGPAYVISNLYLETKPPEKMIIAFWVPFLLLHHARPDNISVYTIEDSLLWIRLIVSVLPKSGGSFIIVYRFILTDCAADWSLRWASSIMLFLGIWKYLESAVALWLSNLGHICKPKKQIDLSDVKRRLSEKLKQRDLSDLNDDEATVKEKDDEALLVAHGLFEICKGAFCDYMVGVDHEEITDMFYDKWETLCTVVEMELSLMYDILYTKAAVVHTLGGYAIRLASPPLTATALLLFVLHCKEEKISLQGQRTPPRAPEALRLAPVHAGVRNGPVEENIYNALAMPYGHSEEQAAEDHWRYDYEQASPEAYEQAEHSCVHGLNRFAYRQDTPNTCFQDDDQAKADTDEQHGDQTKPMDSEEDMEFPPELQEVILIWHIATDVFLSCRPSTAGDKSIELEKAIEQMSDYMMFLVAKRSEMLPGLKLRSLYKNTQDTLKKIWGIKAATEGRKQYTSYVTKEKEELAKWMPGNMDYLKGPCITTTIVWEGTQLARVLLNLAEENEQDTGTVERLAYWVPDLRELPGDMKGMLKLILDAWVRLLLYASIRCSRDSHAKQLSRGGELTTLVWIIAEHAERKFVKEHLPLLFPPKKEKTE